MIVLNIACPSGHRFEGWFASLETFEEQLAAALVSCPHCGDTRLQRLPAAPYLAGRSSQPQSSIETEPDVEKLLSALRLLMADSEDVGNQFPEEARRMHYREAPARSIRGVATADETLELIEEGIDVLPLPFPPKGERH